MLDLDALTGIAVKTPRQSSSGTACPLRSQPTGKQLAASAPEGSTLVASAAEERFKVEHTE
jgi:hypothetical protein